MSMGAKLLLRFILPSEIKTDLSRIFVQMKLSVVNPTETEIIVPKISQYANSQNRINAADFFSNHPFHIRIEGFSRRIFAPSPDGAFRETRWFYERARGQYADARSLLTPAQRKKFDLENPRPQLITKTDLAKFINVWRNSPHIVSLGAQKNFVSFAEYIGGKWEKHKDDINEEWFHDAVAKAIVFRTTEKLVRRQDWYQGGYRANIVAYAIAKMAFDISEMSLSLDFQIIWRRQSLSTCMENNIALVAKEVNEVLVNPPQGFRNVSEWAKKLACWDAIRKLRIDWSREFLENLISTDLQRERNREARKDQKISMKLRHKWPSSKQVLCIGRMSKIGVRRIVYFHQWKSIYWAWYLDLHPKFQLVDNPKDYCKYCPSFRTKDSIEKFH